MNLIDLKKQIESLVGFIGFDYDGDNCGIDPINKNHFEMWCGEDFIIAKSIDEVMNATIFNGKSLIQIYDMIENLDY